MYEDQKPLANLKEEFFKFVKLQRSTTSKLVQTNKDMFMIWGQNGIIITVMAGLYLVVWIFRIGTYQNIIAKSVVFLQRQLLVMFFVKSQFTAVVELGLHDIRRTSEGRFIYSYILSWVVFSITALELIRAYVYIRRKEADVEKMETANREVAHIWNTWTKDLSD